jgi:UDP-N-acetyl-2-amino-2-deoxyglucuronate dehydrogenase
MINFAIVGCGHIAVKHIEAIENISDAKLVALCDTNKERLNEFQTNYGIDGYLSIDEMLEKQMDINVVSICTPSGLHAPLAVKVAMAKKHVIVEKPISLTLTDADAIINACNENGVKLSVVHPNRFRPAVIELKKAMDDGLFGKLSHANATVRWNRNQAYYDQAPWRGTKEMDGGVLMNQAIHNLDLLLWLMGEVEEVQAYAATRLRNIEADDITVATLKFKNGALGLIEAAVTIFPKNLEESLSIFGETGSAIIGGSTANWIKHWVFESMPVNLSTETVNNIDNDPYGIPGHQHIIADMMDAINENRDPVVSGEDGRNALKLVLSVYEAADKNKSVKWSEL